MARLPSAAIRIATGTEGGFRRVPPEFRTGPEAMIGFIREERRELERIEVSRMHRRCRCWKRRLPTPIFAYSR